MLKRFGIALLLGALCVAARADEPRKIAFVDTGNTGRSVSAEALANVLVKQRGWKAAIISRAVDLDPFDVQPEANAAQLLHDRGIDVSRHVAVQMTGNDARHADVILTMTAKHKARVVELFPDAKDKTYTLAEFATGAAADVADAWGKPMEAYVAMFRQLDGYLPPALEKAMAGAR